MPRKTFTVSTLSEYTPELGDTIIDLMSKGYTLTAAAGAVRVHRDTVYGWAERYPYFKEQLDIARQARQLHWEKEIVDTKLGPRVTAAMFVLKNVNPKEWTDRQVQEVSGPDGKPIEISQVQYKII